MFTYTESLLDPRNCPSKRVSRACDRCRLKKTKCDGRRCCNRCLADDAICIFSKRKRSLDRPYSSEYVQLLEDQQMKLVEGVQELYRRLRRGEGWTGPTIAEDSQGYPLVQDVLDSLAVLAPSELRSLKKKADDMNIVDEEEEEEEETEYDCTAPIESTSPFLTSPDCSQSSATSSPVDDLPRNRLNLGYMPSQIQQVTTKPILVGDELAHPDASMQTQSLLVEGSEYWPIPQSFGSSADNQGFAELVDPFISTQANCAWFQGSYMMM